MSLGLKISKLREQAGLSQDELADKIGVSKSSISLWELGKTRPGPKKVIKMASIFNIDVGYFDDNSPKLDSENKSGAAVVTMEQFLELANELRDLNKDLNQRLKNEIAYEKEIKDLRLKIQELEFKLKQG